MMIQKLCLFSFVLCTCVFLYADAQIVKEGDQYKVHDEQKGDEITFTYSDQLLPENSIGTDGWVPECTGLMPFSLKLDLWYGATMSSELKGRGVARWPEAIKLSYEGTPDGGRAVMNYGIEMEALYKNCWGSDTDPKEISEWLNFDLRFFDEKRFTPFLLDGNISNPISLEDSIDNFTLWEGTVGDLIGGSISIPIPIPGLSDLANLIKLKFELEGKMYVEMFGSRIALDEKQQRSIYGDNEYLVIDPPLGGTTLDVSSHFESKTYYETDLILTIDIGLKVLDIQFDPINITLPLIKGNADWTYNSEISTFEFPAVFVASRAHRYLDTVPGDEDYWEFDVENLGTRELVGKVVSDDPAFVVLNDEIRLMPGEKAPISVFFKPYESGGRNGRVLIYSNDPVEPVTAVAVFGYSSEAGTFYGKPKKGDEPRLEVGKERGCSIVSVEREQQPGRYFLLLLSVSLLLVLFFRRQKL